MRDADHRVARYRNEVEKNRSGQCPGTGKPAYRIVLYTDSIIGNSVASQTAHMTIQKHAPDERSSIGEVA